MSTDCNLEVSAVLVREVESLKAVELKISLSPTPIAHRRRVSSFVDLGIIRVRKEGDTLGLIGKVSICALIAIGTTYVST